MKKPLKNFLELAHAYQETAEPPPGMYLNPVKAWEVGFWTAIKFAEEWMKGKKE